MARFVREDIRALEQVQLGSTQLRGELTSLQRQVKSRGLWAAHLHPSMGGRGFGQVKLALMHEVMGGGAFGALVFGAGVDADATELLSAAGTPQQRRRWLLPLLEGETSAAFAFSETRDADVAAVGVSTTAAACGGRWVLNGREWLITDTANADFMIVVALTDSESDRQHRTSAFIVPTDTEGVRIVGDTSGCASRGQAAAGGWPSRVAVMLEDVQVPCDAMLGAPGDGFAIAQNHFGGRRIHHCMRWLGQARRILALMTESPTAGAAPDRAAAADKQMMRDWIGMTEAQIEAARLMTLRAAWMIDNIGFRAARKDSALIKFFCAKLLLDVLDRARHIDNTLECAVGLLAESLYTAAQTERTYRGWCEQPPSSTRRPVPRERRQTPADPPAGTLAVIRR
jgi:acyl-CoA dehydrogenase